MAEIDNVTTYSEKCYLLILIAVTIFYGILRANIFLAYTCSLFNIDSLCNKTLIYRQKHEIKLFFVTRS